MIKDGEKTPLLCPICEPAPTEKPQAKMVLVFDMWEQDETAWGNDNYIHTTICDKVRELKMFKDHPQRTLYPAEYEINDIGFEQIGEDLIGCQSREQEESYLPKKENDEWIIDEVWCANWRIQEAKTFAVCKCMKPHLEVE